MEKEINYLNATFEGTILSKKNPVLAEPERNMPKIYT